MHQKDGGRESELLVCSLLRHGLNISKWCLECKGNPPPQSTVCTSSPVMSWVTFNACSLPEFFLMAHSIASPHAFRRGWSCASSWASCGLVSSDSASVIACTRATCGDLTDLGAWDGSSPLANQVGLLQTTIAQYFMLRDPFLAPFVVKVLHGIILMHGLHLVIVECLGKIQAL